MTADIVHEVQELVARIAKIPVPAPDIDIYTAGLASVDALELLVELEDRFGVTIPDDRFLTGRTSAELAALVTELSTGAAS